ncbi:hypothetical protein [Salinisphaera aquimarina]|uniref:DUF4145 domain-containing protein n=1 Tax=Salinisphaera aquimarina TaxID=2094031 RepID=A0ABV7ER85_9GAMM
MDVILEVLGIIVWPLTVIVIVLILRKPIGDTIRSSKKFKFKDVEIQFDSEARQLREEIEREIPEQEKRVVRLKTEDSDIRFSRARIPPDQRIFVAWQRIEQATNELIERHGLATKSSVSLEKAAKKLLQAGVLDRSSASALEDVAAFRNKAVHYGQSSISQEVADSIEAVANRLTAYFEIL